MEIGRTYLDGLATFFGEGPGAAAVAEIDARLRDRTVAMRTPGR